MTPAPTRQALCYNGEYRHGVDESRRVMIPSKWRPKGAPAEFTVLLWPIAVGDYLLVLPPERWNGLLENLKRQSLSNENVAAIERAIGSASAGVVLDRFGRLVLPDNLARSAGIEKDAALVGWLDKYEIWDPEKYEAARLKDQKLAAEIFKEIIL
jgi:MraZ protein